MPSGISIKDLSFSFNSSRQVLKNINLEINPGEKFGIIGPMGAGKSTLLLHLNGLLTGSGSVQIGNTIVNKKTLPEIRKKVGIVFQNPDDQLFNPTVEEDVAFGPLNFGYSREEVSEMVDYALEAMNLKGFEKLVSHHLSMGERKRVALATVLATKPEVIGFDEPFSSLDPTMIKQLLNILNNLESTLVIISQNYLPLIACCQRVALINQGEIKAVGPTKEIIQNNKLMLENGIDLSLYNTICNDFFQSPKN
jgi:cobalt/nickel transport system ATP-binding protein